MVCLKLSPRAFPAASHPFVVVNLSYVCDGTATPAGPPGESLNLEVGSGLGGPGHDDIGLVIKAMLSQAHRKVGVHHSDHISHKEQDIQFSLHIPLYSQ